MKVSCSIKMCEINSLPNEILVKIFHLILIAHGWNSLMKLRSVSSRFRAVAEKVLYRAKIIEINGFTVRRHGDNERRPNPCLHIDYLLKLSPEAETIELNSLALNFDVFNSIRTILPNARELSLNNCTLEGDIRRYQIPANLRIENLSVVSSLFKQSDMMALLTKFPNLYKFKLHDPAEVHHLARYLYMTPFIIFSCLKSLSIDILLVRNERVVIRNLCINLDLTEIEILNIKSSSENLLFLNSQRHLKTLKLVLINDGANYITLPDAISLETLDLTEILFNENTVLSYETVLDIIVRFKNLKTLKLDYRFTENRVNYCPISIRLLERLLPLGNLENIELRNVQLLTRTHFKALSETDTLKTLTLVNCQNIDLNIIEGFLDSTSRNVNFPEGLRLESHEMYYLECKKQNYVFKLRRNDLYKIEVIRPMLE